MNSLFLAAILIGTVQVTSYRSLKEQTDATPYITASGDHVHRNGVALSRDLLVRFGGVVNYGDIVYVENYGFKVVTDTMNKRHKKHCDLWVATEEEEKAVGWRVGRLWLIKGKNIITNKKE